LLRTGFVSHLNEGKAARAARLAVDWHRDIDNLTSLTE
jgi:hypothetical protein